MHSKLKPLRRAFALALVALTGCLAGGVSLLDAHETFERPGFEETHDESRCGYQHDHTLCVVFQQTPAETAPSAPFRPLAAGELRTTIPRSAFVAVGLYQSGRTARAPPVLL